MIANSPEQVKEIVLKYCDDILHDKLQNCKKEKQAIKRFLKDYKNIKNKSYKYYIDWDGLYHFYKWSMLFKHSKGRIAGEPIILEPFQLWIVCNILFFKKKENNLRRFKEAYVQMARKNAKSQLLALISSYIVFLSPQQEEVYIAGWIKDQSKLVYEEVLTQIRTVKLLKNKFTTSYGVLRVKKNDSIIKPLSREARKKGDGTNPSLTVVDEYGTAHETNEMVDVQQSGTLARPEALTVFITTAGFHLEYPCYKMYEYCEKVLDESREEDDETLFIAIFELDPEDDIKDRSKWRKANPLVGAYEWGLDGIGDLVKKALDRPELMRSVLTKNMNLWVDMPEEEFIDVQRWKQNEVDNEYFEEFIKGAKCYLGFDLSMTTDLTSIGLVFVKNKQYLTKQISFMPREKFNERMSRDKIRFDLYAKNGELVLLPGAVINQQEFKRYLVNLANTYHVEEICYDRYQAFLLVNELEEMGYTMVDVPQTMAALSDPTKRFRETVYDGSLKHCGDGLLKWSIGNARIIKDQNDNIRIGKKVSKDRIDPVAALINAFSRAMVGEMETDLNEYIASGEFSF